MLGQSPLVNSFWPSASHLSVVPFWIQMIILPRKHPAWTRTGLQSGRGCPLPLPLPSTSGLSRGVSGKIPEMPLTVEGTRGSLLLPGSTGWLSISAPEPTRNHPQLGVSGLGLREISAPKVNLRLDQRESYLNRWPTRIMLILNSFRFWLLTVIVCLTDTGGPTWPSHLWKEFEIISLKKCLTFTRRKINSTFAVIAWHLEKINSWCSVGRHFFG